MAVWYQQMFLLHPYFSYKVRVVFDFVLFSKLIRFMCPYYDDSVHRCECLCPTPFQIPLRNERPCLSLTVPMTKPIKDFHRQVVSHAMRTKKLYQIVRFDRVYCLLCFYIILFIIAFIIFSTIPFHKVFIFMSFFFKFLVSYFKLMF